MPVLLKEVVRWENAFDVRHSAALGISLLATAEDLPALRKLGREHPEISIRMLLAEAAARLE